MLGNKKNFFYFVFAMIGGVLLLSFLSYYSTVFNDDLLINNLFFFLALGIITVLAFKNLKYALYFVVLELMLGSNGYLFDLKFSADPDAFRLSIRIAIFLVIILATVFQIIKDKKIKFFNKKNKYWKLTLALALVLLAAGVKGYLLSGFSPALVFADINNYFFFAYLISFWQVDWKKEDYEYLGTAVYAVLWWVNILTFFVFYVFTHLMISWMVPVYKWVRDGRIGEVTRMSMDHSVHRVFMQNHLYLIIAWFAWVLLMYFYPEKYKFSFKKKYLAFSIFGIFTTMTILISQSRSFWLGAVFTFILMFIILLVTKEIDWKKCWKLISIIFLTTIMALAGIAGLIFIELNLGLGSSGNLSFLSDRANASDAAVTSRWNQLPVLWGAIKDRPVLGYGFGKELTYKSDDPRIIRDLAVDGEYTTNAFEWGYLDMTLKTGIIGLLVYLYFIGFLLYQSAKKYLKLELSNEKIYLLVLILAVSFISFVHIFTPYLNHPLGIGVLIALFLFYRE